MSDDTILAPPPIELKDALEERYLAYALSTITQRALPDVREGSSGSPLRVASSRAKGRKRKWRASKTC